MKRMVKYCCMFVTILVVLFCVSMGINKKICNDFIKQAEKNIYQNVDYSLVYDYEYYKDNYPEVAKEFNNDKYGLLSYFVEHGMSEGQQACAGFDVMSYHNAYKDLRLEFGENLKKYYLHYMEYGYNEGRVTTGVDYAYNEDDYSLVYDYDFYVEKYPEIAEKYNGNRDRVLEYFVDYGMNQGQQGNESFNVYIYKENYKDLQIAFGDNIELYYSHYIEYGYKEGRKGI